MGIAYFEKGVEIDIDGKHHLMIRQISEGIWQTEEARTGRLHEFPLVKLQGLYTNGKLVFLKDRKQPAPAPGIAPSKVISVRQTPPEPLWDAAKIRRAYVTALESLPCTANLMKPAIMQVWQRLQKPTKAPHWTSVARWKARYQANGKDAYALVEQHFAKGNHEDRYPQKVIDLVEASIENVYMTRERRTVEDTLEDAIVRVARENKERLASDALPRPTRRLVERCIRKFSAFDIYVSRYGRTAAVRKFRAKLKHVVTDHRLQSAEIDHTKLDVFVLDDDGTPLGRPWITICIDSHTRCILGIYIGFEPPSFLSVARCLKHAFLPKVDLQERFPEINYPWEAHGVMEKIRVDNGLEFHSSSFEKACYSFGIEIEYMPRKKAWFKGKIERLNSTLNHSLSHGIPGTSFSNIFDKDDYDPAKHAVLTLAKLRLVVHKWIADYYHQKPHRGLENMTPAAMWALGLNDEDIPLPDDPTKIDVLLGKSAESTLTHKGIELNCLLYNSRELVDLRRQLGDKLKVEVRVDESDVGHIYVMLPDGSGYIEVPALNQDYAKSLSLWLHNICRRYTKLNLEGNDPATWAKAKVEIRELVNAELKGNRKKSHSRIGRQIEADKAQKPDPVIRKTPATKSLKKPEIKAPSVIPQHKSRPRFTAIIENRGK